MTILLFIITLSLLILVHEWGHFYAARRLGIRVEEFGFGFPPNIVSTVKNGTRFVLNLLPIGGYVKIYGEQGEGAAERESFASRPVWQKFLVLIAGVSMNLVLAWVLFSFVHGIGVADITDAKTDTSVVTIVEVEKGSPAEGAGIKFGDAIQSIVVASQQIPVADILQFQKLIKAHAGEPIEITLKRGNTTREITATPRVNPPAGSGALGIALEYVGIKKSPWYKAPVDGLRSTYNATVGVIVGLGDLIKTLFVQRAVPQDVSGPVGVFRFAGEIRDLGLAYILQFIAVLSVNLAVLNALPIPALDGGRVLFLVFEKLRRKSATPKWENLTHAIGFAVLIILMILITVRDVRNLF